jgi:hypothetical protein
MSVDKRYIWLLLATILTVAIYYTNDIKNSISNIKESINKDITIANKIVDIRSNWQDVAKIKREIDTIVDELNSKNIDISKIVVGKEIRLKSKRLDNQNLSNIINRLLNIGVVFSYLSITNIDKEYVSMELRLKI